MKRYCKNCKYLKKGNFHLRGEPKDFACYYDYPPNRYNPEGKDDNCEYYKRKWRKFWA